MRVMAGYLPTETGLAAVRKAVDEARRSDGELHLVGHVGRPSGDEEARNYESARANRKSELDRYAAHLNASGVRCFTHMPPGHLSVTECLLETARAESIDLLVIGIRERSRVGKLVLGSNALEIIRASKCPVLCVKAED